MRHQTARLRACVLCIAITSTTCARAGEGPPPAYDWRGFYIGAHLGGGLALTHVGDPFGASIYGDTVRAPGPLAGGQLGYNWQLGRGLVGFEADASWADIVGTETCFAYSGDYISANCRATTDATGTLAARFGWLAGPDAATLFYVKAGAAWSHGEIDATTNGDLRDPATRAGGTRWGWMLGAGIERAISRHWSLKAEYDVLSFGDAGLATPVGAVQPVPSPDPSQMTRVASRATEASIDEHLFKIGVNYRLQDAAPDASPPLLSPAPPPITRTTLEIGARYVYGWGRFQKDLGIQGEGVGSLASRLTYSDMTTSGAEMFARLDLPGGLMTKGFVGKGSGSGGHLNDEDWGLPFAIFIPYSNTWSEVDDHIRYGVIDVGYDVWRDATVRIAPFIGYSMFHQYMQAFGCVQVANSHSDCDKPLPISTEGITEDDTWRALRLGVAADLQLLPGLTLGAEAAYLPYVHMNGVDDHVVRDLVSPERANGTGTQLELHLSYAVTERLTVGVGGRYWSMWTSGGTVDFGGETIVPMRYDVEQAALLVQGSYTFGTGD